MKKIILIGICCLLLSATRAQTLLTGLPPISGFVQGYYPLGDTVYIWGGFTQVGDSVRSGIASFNIRTGQVTAWNPQQIAEVTSVTSVGNKLVVGGEFQEVDSQTRYFICMFDMANGGSLDNWQGNANEDNWIQGVGVDGNYFYYDELANDYTGGCVISRVDAVGDTTTSWQTDSVMVGDMDAILVTDSFVYVGGNYYFGLNYGNNINLCRFHKADGSLDTTWMPLPNGEVFNMGINQYGQIFVSGWFNSIAGQGRLGVAGFDANGNLLDFNPYNICGNNGPPQNFGLSVQGDKVWVTGNSPEYGGELRWRIAELDVNNSTATCWDASAVTSAWSIGYFVYVVADTVYAVIGGSSGMSIFVGNPSPRPRANAISGPASVSASQTAIYSAAPDTAAYIYAWYITGGTGHSIGDSINITWGSGPTGVIKLVENNPNFPNCTSDTVELQVSISPPADIQDFSQTSTLHVFPNPATDKVRVETDAANNYFEWYDVAGKLLLKKEVTNQDFDIDLSSFSKGIYFLAINRQGRVIYKDIIKE